MTAWIGECQPSLSFTVSWSLLKFISIETVMLSNHLICCSLLLLSSIFPSIRILSSELALCIRWPKYWSFSFNILPMNIQGWFHLGLTGLIPLQSKRLFKHLLQYRSSKASILQCSTFFTVQLSHPYMTTGKTIALTRQTWVGKVMSLLFNKLSRLVIAFLPRSIFQFHGCSHHLQWFWSPQK